MSESEARRLAELLGRLAQRPGNYAAIRDVCDVLTEAELGWAFHVVGEGPRHTRTLVWVERRAWAVRPARG